MSVKYMLAILLLLQAGSLAAQDEGAKKFYIMPELATYLNLNGVDVDNELGPSTGFHAPATMGWGLGVAFRIKPRAKKAIYFQPTLALRIDPQRLMVNDRSSGFLDQRFTTYYLYTKLMFGATFPLAKQQAIDIALGGGSMFSLRDLQQVNLMHYASYQDASGENLNYLKTFTDMTWGDTRSDRSFFLIPSAVVVFAQVAYVHYGWLGNQKPVRIALEFTTSRGGGNQGSYVQFDQQRNIVGQTKFVDRYQAIGLLLGIGL